VILYLLTKLIKLYISIYIYNTNYNQTNQPTNMSSSDMLPTPVIANYSPDQNPAWVQGAMRQYPQQIYQLWHPIMERDIGFVVGSKGFKIKNINRKTGTFAELRPANQFVTSSHFLIEGFNPLAVQNAWAMINQAACKAEQLNSHGSTPLKSCATTFTKTVVINRDHAGLIIGRDGVTARDIKHWLDLLSLKINTDPESQITTMCIAARSDDVLDRAMVAMRVDFGKAFPDGHDSESRLSPPPRCSCAARRDAQATPPSSPGACTPSPPPPPSSPPPLKRPSRANTFVIHPYEEPALLEARRLWPVRKVPPHGFSIVK
jgi:hypothetical protein